MCCCAQLFPFLSNLERYKGQVMCPKSDVQSPGRWTFKSDKVASESAFLVLSPCWGAAHTCWGAVPTQPSRQSSPRLSLPVTCLRLLVDDILFEDAMAEMSEDGETPRPGCPTGLPEDAEVNSGKVASPNWIRRMLGLMSSFSMLELMPAGRTS